MYIDVNEIECTVMDDKNVLKEKFMRKMKRFMAFALSAAMMLMETVIALLMTMAMTISLCLVPQLVIRQTYLITFPNTTKENRLFISAKGIRRRTTGMY